MQPGESLIEAKEAANGEIERLNSYSDIWEKYNETTYYRENYTEKMSGTYNDTAHDNDGLACPTMTSEGTVCLKIQFSIINTITNYLLPSKQFITIS